MNRKYLNFAVVGFMLYVAVTTLIDTGGKIPIFVPHFRSEDKVQIQASLVSVCERLRKLAAVQCSQTSWNGKTKWWGQVEIIESGQHLSLQQLEGDLVRSGWLSHGGTSAISRPVSSFKRGNLVLGVHAPNAVVKSISVISAE